MRIPLLLAVTAMTSLAAVILLRRRGLAALGVAAGVVLETVGATVLFFVANVTVGGTIILLARRIWFYTTLYDVTDITLLMISLLQAITLTVWLRLK